MEIIKLGKSVAKTQYGDKEKWIVTVRTPDGKTITFDSWCGNWNKDWNIGTKLEPEKDQWKKREYNGKTYWSLGAPESARQFSGGFGGGGQKMQEMEERVAALEIQVASLMRERDTADADSSMDVVGEPEMPATADDFGDEGGVNVDDVPF